MGFFVLERANYDNPNTVHIGGFHNNTHCTFSGIAFNEALTPQLYYKVIMEFIVSKILPIMYSDEINKETPLVTFQAVQFTGDELKSTHNPENYNGRGVLEGGLTYEQAQKYLRSQGNPSTQA